ncbi:Protein MCM10 [Gossypium australe]|uniref:Protein MCM10 n=1 Tax=Gossypium australe TaxID=47621 RepID=A0A5B6VVI3_9ROSI|nr:Protein MCM10 [Gossypium australe]
MMNEWFTEYVRMNTASQQPLPPLVPQSIPVAPQGSEPLHFRATVDDDPKRVEFWLGNTIQVFDELSCTPAECVKSIVSLLRDTTYQWWNTLVSVAPRERLT